MPDVKLTKKQLEDLIGLCEDAVFAPTPDPNRHSEVYMKAYDRLSKRISSALKALRRAYGR